MKYIYHLIIPSAILLLLINIKFQTGSSIIQNTSDSISVLKISFVGDLMCHTPQIEYARKEDGSLDFKSVFELVKPILEYPDYSFGNLETTISEYNKNFSGYPNFSSPIELLDALKWAGFDILLTANNHSADRGIKGIKSTIDKINSVGLQNIGTFRSFVEKDSIQIFYKGEISFAVDAFTYGLNGHALPKENSFMVNLIDTLEIKNRINRIRNKNPDLIIIYFHFGDEYSSTPSLFQKTIVEKTFNYGADIIIASHPHVIQPIISKNNKGRNLGNGIVAYSLGNFISNQQWRFSDAGVILNLQINKNNLSDSLWIEEITTIPTWVFKGRRGNSNQFLIIPMDRTQEKNNYNLERKEDIRRLKQAFNDTQKMTVPRDSL